MKTFKVGVAFSDSYKHYLVKSWLPSDAETLAIEMYREEFKASGQPKVFFCEVQLSHGRTDNSMRRFKVVEEEMDRELKIELQKVEDLRRWSQENRNKELV